nr:nitrate reductase cytochrome c-type subunit [Aestuariispira ectoiniformans]
MGIIVAALTLIISQAVFAQEAGTSIADLRSEEPLADNATPPVMPKTEDKAGRRVRNYPEQPPTIPHEIDGYQVTKNANKCLSCHARNRTGESGAPMLSITHFMDRDYQFLATVSPRRYFCNQCHVPQMDVKPMIENEFVDIDSLILPKNKE